MGKHSSKLKAGDSKPRDSKRLIELISSGNKSSVENFFTAKGISVNTELSGDIKTLPLHVAVDTEPEKYHHDLVEYFISKGADLNVRDCRLGYAPLRYAVEHLNGTAAGALLEAGASVNLFGRCCHYGCPPGFFAYCLLHIVFIKLLSLDRTGKSVSSAAIELVKLLLSHGADCNMFDCSGKTPLHYAVKLNDVTLVCILLDAGANVNSRLVNSNTPIFHASSVSMVKLLLSRNANAEVEARIPDPYKDRRVRSLLYWSLYYWECDIISFLVSEMPVLLHWNSGKWSPLAVAVHKFVTTEVDEFTELKQFKVLHQLVENIRLMIKAGCDPLTEVLERQEWDCFNDYIEYMGSLVRDSSVAELFKAMDTMASSPRSLLNLCTIRIRGILKKNISSVVEFLPLPTNLKRLLTLAS